jgi:hypothetical protein
MTQHQQNNCDSLHLTIQSNQAALYDKLGHIKHSSEFRRRNKCNPTFLQLFETEDSFYAAHDFLNLVLLTFSYIQFILQ